MKYPVRGWLILLCAVSALAISVPPLFAFDFKGVKGPLPVRNYNPVHLMFLSLPVETAAVLPERRSEIRIELAESNVILSEQASDPDVDAVLKFETYRFAFIFRHGISRDLEGGIEIPLLYRGKGVLDPFITSVEEAFKRLSPKRLEFTRGSFGGYRITRSGEVLLQGQNGDFGLGDIALHGKYRLWTESGKRPALSLRAGVKLPTGRERLLYGRDKTDLGVGMILQKRVHPRLALHLQENVVFPLGKFLSTGFTLNPISTTVLAVEWILSPRFSWLTQFDFYTSPFHGTDVEVLDLGTFELALGFDYALRPHVLWQLYVVENFNVPFFGGSADFSLLTAVSYRF